MVCTIKRDKLQKPNLTKNERIAHQKLQRRKGDRLTRGQRQGYRTYKHCWVQGKEGNSDLCVMRTHTPNSTRIPPPNTRTNSSIVSIIRRWKRYEHISDNLYWRLYPDSEEPLNSMILLRSIKPTTLWDQSYPAVAASHTELLNIWQASLLP